MNNPQSRKRKAYWWGQCAEGLAALWLFFKGYRILARRFKCRVGEIDLIARRGTTLCFIEVKARRTKDQALCAVSLHQQKRIIRAAEWYMSRQNPTSQKFYWRFDIIAVEPWALLTHVKDAWQA